MAIRPLPDRPTDDRGVAAVLTAILMPVILGICALVVDVGAWYVEADELQRAADAAALAGTVYLPGDLTSARAEALRIATANGFTTGGVTTVTPEQVSGQPSRLRVTITTTVRNTFGALIGVPTETITRTAVATYQAPLPMGSPCNEFGNGPEPVTGARAVRSANCSAAGQFWANVGSAPTPKSYGDAYADGNCQGSAPATDFCTAGANTEYSASGYYYRVTVSRPVSSLTVQAFDPAFVSVGDTCSSANFGSGSTAATAARNPYVYDYARKAPLTDPALYASGSSGAYCTGDNLYGGSPPDTTYTVLAPTAGSTPNDPGTYAAVSGCRQTFGGYTGSLFAALNQYSSGTTVSATYRPDIAREFRQWVPLCTMAGTVGPGTYFIQVQTNAAEDTTSGNGHNRFSLRAFGAGTGDGDAIAISGLTSMAIYANLPGARTSFYLTQVPPSAAGSTVAVRLFDIGDSAGSGTVTVVPPADSGLSSFSGCVGAGATTGALAGCSIPANSSYDGRWETISIPVPASYTCSAASATGCWLTLTYNYGSGNQPKDTTTWTASLTGNPVRLVS